MNHRPIEQIQHDLGLARQLVDELKKELQAAREAACDIKVGDRVIKTWGRSSEEEYEVSHIEFWSLVRPSLHGYKIKKDGTPGVRSTYIGTKWEKKA